MGDHHKRIIGRTQAVDTLTHNPEGIHVQATVGLVQDGQVGLQHRHLEDFVALFFAAREAHIYAAGQETAVHLHQGQLAVHQLDELCTGEWRQSLCLAVRSNGALKHLGVGHPGDLHGILESQENAFPGTFFRRKGQQGLAVQQGIAFRHSVARLARQNPAEGAFAGAVGPHYGVHFAPGNLQVDAAQDFAVLYRGVQIVDIQ